ALTPAELSRLAGWAGVPLSSVYRQRDRGRPLAVRAAASRAAARRDRQALERDSGVEGSVYAPPSLLVATALAGLALTGTAAFAVAVLLGWMWLALAAALVFAVGLGGSALWLRAGRQF